MNFNVKSPCNDCPFRTDHPIPLASGRIEEILNFVLRRDKTFACHKTTHGAKRETSHCAGALILLEKSGRPNFLPRLAHMLGLFDPSKLNMAAPVENEHEIREAHKRLDIR